MADFICPGKCNCSSICQLRGGLLCLGWSHSVVSYQPGLWCLVYYYYGSEFNQKQVHLQRCLQSTAMFTIQTKDQLALHAV
jgi:hypothetical protein